MPDPIAIYDVRASGLLRGRQEVRARTEAGSEPAGVIELERNARGLVVRGRYRPEKGEVLSFRRDPGLLRSQFSLWTESREWLGSSLRWGWVRRTIEVSTSTSNKPYQMVPLTGLACGWRLVAPKTGEAARFRLGLLGRRARIEVLRRLDTELVMFAYFVASQVRLESLPPGRLLEDEHRAPTPSKA
jgi:hypothetical protein